MIHSVCKRKLSALQEGGEMRLPTDIDQIKTEVLKREAETRARLNPTQKHIRERDQPVSAN